MSFHPYIVGVYHGDTMLERFYAWPSTMPLPEENRLTLAEDEEPPDNACELCVDDFDEACRVLALMLAIGEYDLADSATIGHNEFVVEVGRREWLVVTDSEADDLWDESLDNYLDNCVLHELPELAQRYFDREAWKKDAKTDGRAHSLNHYDGNEEYADVEGTQYWVYRQN